MDLVLLIGGVACLLCFADNAILPHATTCATPFFVLFFVLLFCAEDQRFATGSFSPGIATSCPVAAILQHHSPSQPSWSAAGKHGARIASCCTMTMRPVSQSRACTAASNRSAPGSPKGMAQCRSVHRTSDRTAGKYNSRRAWCRSGRRSIPVVPASQVVRPSVEACQIIAQVERVATKISP